MITPIRPASGGSTASRNNAAPRPQTINTAAVAPSSEGRRYGQIAVDAGPVNVLTAAACSQ